MTVTDKNSWHLAFINDYDMIVSILVLQKFSDASIKLK